MNIIGLGKAGCAIADKFAEYPQYKTFKIDIGLEGENCFNIPRQKSPEAYEETAPPMEEFFSKVTGEVIFAICGAVMISGMSLAVLEQLKGHDTSILYIRPDVSLLSEKKMLQERVVFNVLQQYARSGLLKRIYLISNSRVEEIMGDIPIIGYYDRINGMIV